MKVLISAFACEPDKGSEPGVGWNWVKQSARFSEVWAMTRADHREAIERALQQEPIPNVHWVYFDLPRWAGFWKKGQRGMRSYYSLWQIGAYFVGKRLHRTVHFDLVHHVTFASYWMPGFLSFLPIPFVWGPVGGGDSSPKTFYKTFSFRGKVYEWLRSMAIWIGERNPVVWLGARRAAKALASTAETAVRLRLLGANKVSLYSQIGIAKEEFVNLTLSFRNITPFRLVSIGNLLHLKGFHLGLTAFSSFQQVFPDTEYWLIGDGPEQQNLDRLVRTLGIAEKVRFWGRLPRQQVLSKLAECDVLVHPSLHDSGGCVCLEAMAVGCPVICLDLGGPATQVTEETGFKVSAITPEQVVNDLMQAMLWLAHNPDGRKRMAEAGQKRVAEHFEWDKKGEWMREVYQEVVGVGISEFSNRGS
jgi:glycosyltransferase involved in cell wall biosynthesis